MNRKARKSTEQAYAGPPAVRSWQDMDEKRDASPVVLKRKFVAVRTRHRNLAEAEACIRAYNELPDDQVCEETHVALKRRRDNAEAWLNFTLATLDQHLQFAVARYDGSLDAVRPLPNGRLRKTCDKKEFIKARQLVDYYRESLDEFKLAAAAAAGSWTRTVCSAAKHGACEEYRSGQTTMKKNGKVIVACKHIIADSDRHPVGGHAGSEEAVKDLIARAHSVIEFVKSHSGREPEVAEQLAWVEVLETAARFDPTISNMARFNTYYTYRARRATQIRSDNDCPPGQMRIKGRIMARGTIHIDDDQRDSAFLHPATHDIYDNNAMKEAVTSALASLPTDEQEVATQYLMGEVSLRKLAEQRNLTMHQVRKLVSNVVSKLQVSLKSFAEH